MDKISEKIYFGGNVLRSFYTNLNNSAKIDELSGIDKNWYTKKSPKGVYDAINEDFSLIIEP